MKTRSPNEMEAELRERGYYIHAQQVWDLDKAESFAKTRGKDGLGTFDPWPGMFKTGPNGLIVKGPRFFNDQEYIGEVCLLPEVPADFKWEYILTWGWRLVKVTT